MIIPPPSELTHFNKEARPSTVRAVHDFYYQYKDSEPVRRFSGGGGRKPVEIINNTQWWWVWEYSEDSNITDIIEGGCMIHFGQSRTNLVSPSSIVDVLKHLEVISTNEIKNHLNVSSKHARKIMQVIKIIYPRIYSFVEKNRIRIEASMESESEWIIMSDSVIYKDSNGVLRVDNEGVFSDEFFD